MPRDFLPRRVTLGAIAVVAVAALLAGCSNGAKPDPSSTAGGAGGTLRVAINQSLSDWEPLNTPNSAYTSLVYEGLMGLEPDGATITPALATEWVNNPLDIEFTLREGVLFQDGTKFDAAAVVKNLERMRDTPSQWQNAMDSVSAIEAVDDTHVKITLDAPSPNFFPSLAQRGAMMIAPSVLDDGTFKENPVGTGPWKYDKADSTSGSKIVATAFDQYWDAANRGPDKVEITYIGDPNSLLNALRTGEQDVVWTNAATTKQADAAGFTTENYPALTFQLLMMDTADTFANADVRKAICYAMNPQDYIDTLFGGEGDVLSQHLRPNQPGYVDSLKGYSHDVDKAKKIMNSIGNPKVGFTLIVYSDLLPVANLFQSEMAEIGIDVKVEAPTFNQYFSTYRNGQYPATILAEGADTGPYDWYLYHFAENGGGNPYKVKYPEIDAIAQKALNAATDDEADKAWQDMTQTVNDEALECGFFTYTGFWAYDKKTVDNIVSTQGDVAVFRYKEAKLR
ncbi:ABC-type transport system, substrate-binding protein [Agreia bicolorata]|uniref:ABC-type transport system, substrate-binding protein n=1 Tax=Agreia bicolorata TaxID=110935 RepID=A0A1T4WYN9_9MICO|nr:ABC transporter substrate-binding protein [Agreia bicolorata]SKA81721.1 ABC-type transport system, substrate-binding protein [Agreia bicolorata]